MSKLIRDIPEADRPREKLLRKGAAALSDQELLAVLLGKGTRDMDVMKLAGKLAIVIDEKGLGVQADDLLPHVRHYADRKQEHFLCASINGANEILNIRVISIGLIDRTQVHPREVFAEALVDRASAVIVAHNHPAGSLEPSVSDADVTKQLKAAGEVLGISLLDHIIFNRSGYYSFLESGQL